MFWNKKRGLEMPWNVLVPLMVMLGVLILILIFSALAGEAMDKASDYLKNLLKFG